MCLLLLLCVYTFIGIEMYTMSFATSNYVATYHDSPSQIFCLPVVASLLSAHCDRHTQLKLYVCTVYV